MAAERNSTEGTESKCTDKTKCVDGINAHTVTFHSDLSVNSIQQR